MQNISQSSVLSQTLNNNAPASDASTSDILRNHSLDQLLTVSSERMDTQAALDKYDFDVQQDADFQAGQIVYPYSDKQASVLFRMVLRNAQRLFRTSVVSCIVM